jgi:hypothetical protein
MKTSKMRRRKRDDKALMVASFNGIVLSRPLPPTQRRVKSMSELVFVQDTQAYNKPVIAKASRATGVEIVVKDDPVGEYSTPEGFMCSIWLKSGNQSLFLSEFNDLLSVIEDHVEACEKHSLKIIPVASVSSSRN